MRAGIPNKTLFGKNWTETTKRKFNKRNTDLIYTRHKTIASYQQSFAISSTPTYI